MALVQHYFASAWILPQGQPRDLFMRKVDTNLYAAGMITAPQAVAPGATATVQSTFFTGPQEEKMLERVAPGVSGLGLVRALLPRRSAILSLEQQEDQVVCRLELIPPSVVHNPATRSGS